ncbi:MAG: hypothetical protein ACLGHL_01725 [Actinomycetota bacterium]
MRKIDDEAGIIVAWLVKIVIGFALFGVVAFDAGSIVYNFFTLDQAAKDIANDLSVDTITPSNGLRLDQLEDQARALAKEVGARLTKLEVSPEGDVSVQLKRKATTLLVSRIGPIEDWARATADATIRNTR